MARYQVFDYMTNKLLFTSDDLQEVAAHVDLAVSSLQVGLSAGRGTYTRKTGKMPMRVVDTERGRHKPGPRPQAWIYLKYYPDAEIGLSAAWETEHVVTYDEIIEEAKGFYQPLAPATVEARLASPDGLRAFVRRPGTYRRDSVHFVRIPAERFNDWWSALDQARRDQLTASRQRYLDRLAKRVTETKK